MRVPQAASTAATGAKSGVTGSPVAEESRVGADIRLTAPFVTVGVDGTDGVTADVATAVAATARGVGDDVVSGSTLAARGAAFLVEPVTVLAVICVVAGASAAVGFALRCFSLLDLGGRFVFPAFVPGALVLVAAGASVCDARSRGSSSVCW